MSMCYLIEEIGFEQWQELWKEWKPKLAFADSNISQKLSESLNDGDEVDSALKMWKKYFRYEKISLSIVTLVYLSGLSYYFTKFW